MQIAREYHLWLLWSLNYDAEAGGDSRMYWVHFSENLPTHYAMNRDFTVLFYAVQVNTDSDVKKNLEV